jgi:hypothetical protein
MLPIKMNVQCAAPVSLLPAQGEGSVIANPHAACAQLTCVLISSLSSICLFDGVLIH